MNRQTKQSCQSPVSNDAFQVLHFKLIRGKFSSEGYKVLATSRYEARAPRNSKVAAWVMTLDDTGTNEGSFGYAVNWFKLSITRQRDEASVSRNVRFEAPEDGRVQDPRRSVHMRCSWQQWGWNDDLVALKIDVHVTETKDGFRIEHVQGDLSAN